MKRVLAVPTVRSCPLPSEALLNRYAGSGGYADCYVTELPRAVTHPEFVEAFYTTAVFKLERLLLRLFVSRPSSDLQAGQLARGESDAFAAWSVEGRAPNQLLLSDYAGRTRSWLMVARSAGAGPAATQLYFGSAVVPASRSRSGRAGMGPVFAALLGLHKVYSRVLLRAARSRLSRTRASQARGA